MLVYGESSQGLLAAHKRRRMSFVRGAGSGVVFHDLVDPRPAWRIWALKHSRAAAYITQSFGGQEP